MFDVCDRSENFRAPQKNKMHFEEGESKQAEGRVRVGLPDRIIGRRQFISVRQTKLKEVVRFHENILTRCQT